MGGIRCIKNGPTVCLIADERSPYPTSHRVYIAREADEDSFTRISPDFVTYEGVAASVAEIKRELDELLAAAKRHFDKPLGER